LVLRDFSSPNFAKHRSALTLAPGENDFERTASRLCHMQAADYWQREGAKS
jgi:predicted ATPase